MLGSDISDDEQDATEAELNSLKENKVESETAEGNSQLPSSSNDEVGIYILFTIVEGSGPRETTCSDFLLCIMYRAN